MNIDLFYLHTLPNGDVLVCCVIMLIGWLVAYIPDTKPIPNIQNKTQTQYRPDELTNSNQTISSLFPGGRLLRHVWVNSGPNLPNLDTNFERL